MKVLLKIENEPKMVMKIVSIDNLEITCCMMVKCYVIKPFIHGHLYFFLSSLVKLF